MARHAAIGGVVESFEAAEKLDGNKEHDRSGLKPDSKHCYGSGDLLRHPKPSTKSNFSATC
jgi:hypothetical protein